MGYDESFWREGGREGGREGRTGQVEVGNEGRMEKQGVGGGS